MEAVISGWETHLLFPTRVHLTQSDDENMRQELLTMFREESVFYQENFAEVADLHNLLDFAPRYPAILKLKEFFWSGLREWLKAEGVQGNYLVHTNLFPNFSKKSQFVPAHNHLTHVSGVYYVDVPAFNSNEVIVQGDYKRYWRMEYGVLILHDPRFNASLCELTEKNYAKVFPKPGTAILFPSYLWHSVTPHNEDKHRISIAANFSIVEEEEAQLSYEPMKI